MYRGKFEFFYDFSKDQLIKFLAEKGDWDTVIKKDARMIVDHFKKSENVAAVGFIGYCWGGFMVCKATTQFPEAAVGGFVREILFYFYIIYLFSIMVKLIMIYL